MSQRKFFWPVALSLLTYCFLAVQTGCQPPQPASPPESENATPATPPAAEPSSEPSSEPAAEPESKPAAEPAAKSEEKPAAKSEEKPAAEPAAKPEEKPAAKSEEKPAAADAAALPKVPLGLPPVPVPPDNPMTPEKVSLGKKLYFDTRLSKDNTISCATCHDPKMAWAQHTPTSEGINHQFGGANSPTVINAAYGTTQFWDGRAASLEEQALGPIANPVEMGNTHEAMVQTLIAMPEYKEEFQKVFGTDVTKDGVAKAIAAFERTVLSGNSPYDKFQAGQADALNESQKRGMDLFNNVGCAGCHTPPVFSSYSFQNAGIGMDKDPPDQGRKAVTGRDSDLGKYRVPALREVANTYPYFHDGSVATLEEAVDIMASGGKDNPKLSPMLKAVGAEELTDQDKKDLVEFLKALSGDYPNKENSGV